MLFLYLASAAIVTAHLLKHILVKRQPVSLGEFITMVFCVTTPIINTTLAILALLDLIAARIDFDKIIINKKDNT